MNRRVLFILLGIFAVLIVFTILQNQSIKQQIAESTPIVSFLRVYPDMAVLDIQAVRMSVRGGDNVFILSRGSDDQWTAPSSSGVLNTDIASSIIRTVILLPYQETLPLMDSTVLSDYGFGDGQQQFVIEILLKTGEGHIVVIGDMTPTRSAYYALVDNADKIYLLERGAVDFLITQWRTPPLT